LFVVVLEKLGFNEFHDIILEQAALKSCSVAGAVNQLNLHSFSLYRKSSYFSRWLVEKSLSFRGGLLVLLQKGCGCRLVKYHQQMFYKSGLADSSLTHN
jgi:hypothetical protein